MGGRWDAGGRCDGGRLGVGADRCHTPEEVGADLGGAVGDGRAHDGGRVLDATADQSGRSLPASERPARQRVHQVGLVTAGDVEVRGGEAQLLDGVPCERGRGGRAVRAGLQDRGDPERAELGRNLGADGGGPTDEEDVADPVSLEDAQLGAGQRCVDAVDQQ